MTARKEYGEFTISTPDKDYLFRPSFDAMTRIGTPEQIVNAFTLLSGAEVQMLIARAIQAYGAVPEWLFKALKKPTYGRSVLSTSMMVMQACCNGDCDELIGEWKPSKNGVIYKMGKVPITDIIVFARELMTHGIIGKAKVRKLQRNEGKNEFTDSFNAIEYITAARAHFGVNREEAEQLTMTEFVMMLKAKYPDEKGFTREEYDEIMKADDQRNEELATGKRRLVSRK
ncbi:DUF6246 family protein [Providencia rettgeri]|uniref:DUF6246 family protein n=1 Tax=Providencia rettgeri TaxID=587 RepID=UPI0018C7D96A|nr:DUF6246 family protein [Providencia rettgeri]MBG5923151.1 hypothetical protein [Providencia rettgeri]